MTPTLEFTPEVLQSVSDQFENASPSKILQWGVNTFGPDLVLATGFGPEGVVLMHQLAEVAPQATVFYLDTSLLFPETYALRDALMARLRLNFVQVKSRLTLDTQAHLHGPELWAHNPDLCCRLRKVEPLRQFLANYRAWITGIRRDQTRHRAKAGLVEWDAANELVKLNPLGNWTSEDVWAYIQANDLPTNALHAQGYPSIGCWPCTQPVQAGEDPRAGRWRGRTKTECGIHLSIPQLQAQ